MKQAIRLKRVYEPPTRADGFRVLVDGLWPRGVSKKSARVESWLKEIAPSAALRKWFAHDLSKWNGFRARYFRELRKNPEAVAHLDKFIGKGTVTLLFAAKDEEHNNAVALKEYLESRRKDAVSRAHSGVSRPKLLGLANRKRAKE